MTFEHTWTSRKCCGKEIYKRPGALLGGILRKVRLRRRPGEPSLLKTFYATFALLHIPQMRKSRVPSADDLLGWHAFVTASTCSAFSVRFPLLPLLTVLRRRTLRTWFELFILNDEALPFANVAKLLVGLLGWRRGRRRRCRTRKRAEIAGEVDQKPAGVVNGVAEMGTNGCNVVFEGNPS